LGRLREPGGDQGAIEREGGEAARESSAQTRGEGEDRRRAEESDDEVEQLGCLERADGDRDGVGHLAQGRFFDDEEIGVGVCEVAVAGELRRRRQALPHRVGLNLRGERAKQVEPEAGERRASQEVVPEGARCWLVQPDGCDQTLAP
jgi:hypothetical protein